MVPRETDWIPAFRLSPPTGPFKRQVAGSLRRTTGLREAKLGSRPSSREALGHNFPSAVGRSCRQPKLGSIRGGNPYDGGPPPVLPLRPRECICGTIPRPLQRLTGTTVRTLTLLAINNNSNKEAAEAFPRPSLAQSYPQRMHSCRFFWNNNRIRGATDDMPLRPNGLGFILCYWGRRACPGSTAA